MPIAPKHRPLQRGVTLIELMIAIAIGLFITAITIKVVVDRLADDRIHIAEIRLNQNLRAAADIIARELRRAGHWEQALDGVFKNDGSAPLLNDYAPILWRQKSEPAQFGLDYKYQRSGTAAFAFGFRRSLKTGIGVLQFSETPAVETSWQDLTDPQLVDILDGFVIQPVPAASPVDGDTVSGREVDLFEFCSCWIQVTCTKSALENPPRLVIRQIEIRMPARSVVEPSIERELVETVRVRNDELVGSCKLKSP